MAVRFRLPSDSLLDSNGNPLNGGKLYFYVTNTSTPKNTYTDEDLDTANANPVILDAAGRHSDIWLAFGSYKVVLKDSADVTIKTMDPVLSGDELLSISPEAYGAIADGVTDDYAAIIDAIEAARALWTANAEGNMSVSVNFTTGKKYYSSAGIPLITGVTLTSEYPGASQIYVGGSGAAIYTATYSGGVFTDNLDASASDVSTDAKSVVSAGLINIMVEHTGTISGNAGSGEAWEAAVEIVGAPTIPIHNLRVTHRTNSYNALQVKHSWRADIRRPYVTRGGFTGGNGIFIDATCNNTVLDHPFVFGAWAVGIRSTNPDSVTIIEPNVEATTIGLLLGGVCPRLIGGYLEGNGTDIQLGVISATAATGWLIEGTWHNGNSSTYGIYFANCTAGRCVRPVFQGTYTTTVFRSGTVANGNFGNIIEYTVSDASSPGLSGLGLADGRNVVIARGTDNDDQRFYKLYRTSDQTEVEMELNQRGAAMQSFCIQVINDGGTIKHRISVGENNTLPTYSNKIIGASTTLAATPTVTGAVDFTSGAGLRDSNTHQVILDTADQTPLAEFSLMAAVQHNDIDTVLNVLAFPLSSDVNGETIVRPVLSFTNASDGTSFALSTGNIDSGESVTVRVFGFIR